MAILSETEEKYFKESLEKSMLKTLDDLTRKFGIDGWKYEDLADLLPVFNRHAEILIHRINIKSND